MSMNSDYFYQQVSTQRFHELTARAAEERLARELPRSRRPWWQRLMGLSWRTARAEAIAARRADAEAARAAAARDEAVRAAQRRNHPSVRARTRNVAP